MKTPKSPELIKHMLAELDNNLVKELTEWEDNFITSIRQQFEQRNDLSQKQFEILDRIYAEKTA